MTNEEALEKITNLAVTYSQINAETCELLTIAKDAIESRTRKPVIKRYEKRPSLYSGEVTIYKHYCPTCGHFIQYSGHYCPDCGQALDWSRAE